MECPNCGCRDLQLTVVLTGDVDCRFRGDTYELLGESIAFDSAWDRQTPSRCLACNWQGKVEDAMQFQEEPYRTEEPGPLSETDLAEIEREIDGGNCPPELLSHFQTLLSQVRVMRAQLDVVRRATKSSRRADSTGDTGVF